MKCRSIKEVKIPYSVANIGEGAFSECTSLTSFSGKFASEDNRCLIIDCVLHSFAPAGLDPYVIPNSITEIGGSSFLGYSELKSLVIPKNVTEIGQSAFSGCSGIKEIISLNTTPPSTNAWSFDNISSTDCVIKIPAVSVDEYKNRWNEFKTFVPLTNDEILALGIESAKAGAVSSNGQSFNLSGQRVGEGAKGIVIRDGKKIIMR